MTQDQLQEAVTQLMKMDDAVHWLEINLPEEFQKQVATLAKKVGALQGTMNHNLQYIAE